MLQQISIEEVEKYKNMELYDECFFDEKTWQFCQWNTLSGDFINTIYGETKSIEDFIRDVIRLNKTDDLWEPGLRTISQYYKYYSMWLIGPKNNPEDYVHPVFFCIDLKNNMAYAVVVLLKKYTSQANKRIR